MEIGTGTEGSHPLPETAKCDVVSLLVTDLRAMNVPSLTLTLQESQDVVRPNGSLHVANDGTAGIVQELNSDLSDTTTRTSPAEDLLRVIHNFAQ